MKERYRFIADELLTEIYARTSDSNPVDLIASYLQKAYEAGQKDGVEADAWWHALDEDISYQLDHNDISYLAEWAEYVPYQNTIDSEGS